MESLVSAELFDDNEQSQLLLFCMARSVSAERVVW
jgi:hypothetical protein